MWSEDLPLAHSKGLISSQPPNLQNLLYKDNIQPIAEHLYKPVILQAERQVNSHAPSYPAPADIRSRIQPAKPIDVILEKHKSSLSTSSSVHLNTKNNLNSEVSFAQNSGLPTFPESRLTSAASLYFSDKSNSGAVSGSMAADYFEYIGAMKQNPNGVAVENQQFGHLNIQHSTIPFGNTTAPLNSQRIQEAPHPRQSSTGKLGENENQKESARFSLSNRRGSYKENVAVNYEEVMNGISANPVNKGIRNETNSAAVVGAMKALQEKIVGAEAEIKQLRKQLGEKTQQGMRENETFGQNESNNDSMKHGSRQLSEESESLKAQINGLKREVKVLTQENQMLQREKAALEYDKECCMKNSAASQEMFQNYTEELIKKLDSERKRNQALEEQLTRVFGSRTDRPADLSMSRRQSTGSFDRSQQSIGENDRIRSLRRKNKGRKLSEASDSSLRRKAKRDEERKRIEVLEKENVGLKTLNYKMKEDIAKLERKIAVLRVTREKLTKDNERKDELYNQVVDVNRELISKLSENLKYADLRDVLNKMSEIERSLKRGKSPNATGRSLDRSNLSSRSVSKSRSPSGKDKSKGRLSVRDIEKSLGNSISQGNVSYRKMNTSKEPTPKKKKQQGNKEASGAKRRKKSSGRLAEEDLSMSRNSKSFLGSEGNESLRYGVSGNTRRKSVMG